MAILFAAGAYVFITHKGFVVDQPVSGPAAPPVSGKPPENVPVNPPDKVPVKPPEKVTKKPTTCRELVEHLRLRGMDLDWGTWAAQPDGMPAVWVARKDEWEMVFVAQYPTTQAARDKAGALKEAFSYERFVISSPPAFPFLDLPESKLLKEIKSRL
jgi:hypothetical protein